MNDALIFAASKLLKSKYEPRVGETRVQGQIVLDVDAVISKQADELYTPTMHIPYLKVFANFAKISGITREKALSNFREAMIASLNNDTEASAELEQLVPQLEEFETMIKEEVLQNLPKQLRKGKVSVKGELLNSVSEAV